MLYPGVMSAVTFSMKTQDRLQLDRLIGSLWTAVPGDIATLKERILHTVAAKVSSLKLQTTLQFPDAYFNITCNISFC